MIDKEQLTSCDKEPIHIPSRIQNTGYMIVVQNSTFNILQVSDNIKSLFQEDSDKVIGDTLYSYLKENFINKIENIINQSDGDEKNIFLEISILNKNYFGVLHKNIDYFIMELEPADNKQEDVTKDTQSVISMSMKHCNSDLSLQELLEEIAVSVKKISGFDRVLVYKFDEDGHGSVLAQAKEDFCENFLNHYFPASDIPKQARELYLKNKFRIIEDVKSQTSNLIPYLNPITNSPLDMSFCCLRAVSPIHIEYLKNMKVASSMSISLIIGGKLWGLVACHNYSAKYISLKNHKTYDILSDIYSSQIEHKQLILQHKRFSDLQYKRQLFLNLIDSSDEIEYKKVLRKYSNFLKDTVTCDICVLFYKEDIICSSLEIPKDELFVLLDIFKQNAQDDLFYCSNLGLNYPSADNLSIKPGGMICQTVSKSDSIYLMFIRFEQIYYRKWAGEPKKEVTYKNGIIQIEPRASFETWKECVKGSCERFNEDEIESVKITANQLNIIIEKFKFYFEAKRLKLENKKQKELFLINKMDSLQELIRNIAHQWRQPLNVISIGTTTLRLKNEMETLDKDSFYKTIESITKSTQYLSKTIEDFELLLKNEEKYEEFEYETLIESFLRLTENITEENGIKIILNIDDNLKSKGYPNQLLQCFINFLNNSKDAFINNDIKLNERFIFISLYPNRNGVILEFKDTAGGIDENIILKVFEPYFTTKHQSLGTGLGLSSSYNFIKKSMKGEINLENEEFYFNDKKYSGVKITVHLPSL